MDNVEASVALNCTVCREKREDWTNILGHVICNDCAAIVLNQAARVLMAFSPVAFSTCLQTARSEVG